jgi:hypothetical protein
MAMKSRSATSFVMFDVVYEDGTRSSNRKVLASALTGLDGDEPARGIVEAQDREIANASGRPRSDVKSIFRSPPKVVNEDDGKKRGGKR